MLFFVAIQLIIQMYTSIIASTAQSDTWKFPEHMP